MLVMENRPQFNMDNPPFDYDQLLTLNEVGDILRLEWTSVRQLIADRRLEAIRVGKRRLVVRSFALRDFIKKNTLPTEE